MFLECTIYLFMYLFLEKRIKMLQFNMGMAIEMGEGREETLKLLSKITITLVSNNCCSP